MYSKKSKKLKKRTKKKIRWLLTLLVVVLLFYLNESHQLAEIKSGETPVLYSSICEDNLEKLFIEAVKGSKESILLIIYSLSDSKLIQSLNEQAQCGVFIKVVHDASTSSYGLQKLHANIDVQEVKMSGLMHQKILVVDEEKVWIGSANMTAESLRLHDNLVVGLINPQLAQAIKNHIPYVLLSCEDQVIEYWSFPQKGKEGLDRLINLIDGAQKTLRVAMFTWTHVELTAAIIRAHQRRVDVEVILDRGQAHGVCQQTLNTLNHAGIKVRLNSGPGLLHHKFAWIDETVLVNGSANWTSSAFTRNRDCFLIIHPLTFAQNAKMRELWKKTKASSIKEYLEIPLAA